jgi:hypothetical protein
MSLRKILEDRDLLLLLGIVLVGAGLRVGDFSTYWLNPDEGIYHALAATPEWSDFWAEVAVNAHPPLFYLTLRGLAAVGGDPEWLRLPALLFGCLAIPAAFLAVRPLLGPVAGLLAAAAVAVAPGLVVQSQLVRPYAMLVALLGFGLYFLLRYLEGGRRSDWVACTLLLLASVLTHYAAIMAEAALALTLLGGVLLGRVPRARLPSLAGALAPAGLAFVGLYSLHLAPNFLSDKAPLWLGGAGLSLAYPHLFHDSLLELWGGVVGVHHYLFGPRLGAVATLLFLIGLGSLSWRRAFGIPGFALAALLLAGGLSVLERYPFGASRHSLYLAVALVPCVAAGLHFLLVRRAREAVVAGALLLLLAVFPAPLRSLLGTPPLRITPEKVTPHEVARRYADLVASARGEKAVLVLDKQTYFMLMPYLDLPYPHEVRDAPETVGQRRAGLVPWGDASLLVSSAWNFNLDPHSVRAPTNLMGFLESAAGGFPDLGLRERHDGLLLFGGWGAPFYAKLEALDRGLGEEACFGDVEMARGFGSAPLDFAVCLEEGRRGAARSRPIGGGLRIQ